MILPASVEIVAKTAEGAPAPGLLLSAAFCVNQRPYFFALLPLTDEQGITRTTRDTIERAFAENRQLFLMDYKVPLEECDDRIAVSLEGGETFRAQREQALASPLVRADAKAKWAAAVNARFKSLSAWIAVPPSGAGLRVEIVAARSRASV